MNYELQWIIASLRCKWGFFGDCGGQGEEGKTFIVLKSDRLNLDFRSSGEDPKVSLLELTLIPRAGHHR